MDWKQGIRAPDPIDPSDKLDYAFDFGPFLTADGDAASTITAVATNCTIDSGLTDITGDVITVWIHTATAGVDATITFKCTSVQGRIIERTVKIWVRDL